MTEEELKAILHNADVPFRSPEPQQRARQRVLAEFRKAASYPEEKGGRSSTVVRFPIPVFLAGLAAGLIAATVLWFLLPEETVEIARQGDTRLSWAEDFRVLTEVERIFPGQLSAVVLGAAADEIFLTQESAVPGRPVAVRFQRGGEQLRVLTFDGRTVSAGIDGRTLTFEIAISESGAVILTGTDFLWTSDAPAEWAGFTVEARPLGPS